MARIAILALACLGVFGIVLLAQAPPQLGRRENIAATEPRTPVEERKLFHLPPGFVIELVAAEPDIQKPINLNFDDRGRLWVSCTVEYPFPAPPDRKPRDSIKVLESTRGDGVYDKVTTFADGLNIPIGVLPVTVPGPDGKQCQGAIVHSIPNIHLLVDSDGEGKANRREVLYGTFGAKDTHGMTGSFTRGFDGWVYAHHGYANTSQVKAGDGSNLHMQSGNTYRFRPDGTRVEQFTWGQVNPFGLCFDPLGNLYSADCHSRPAMLLLRGGCYPSFGKPHDGLGFAPELMSHSHGSTAICGITYYAADQFPPAYRDTLFIGNVVTSRINHDRLERTGSSYKAIEQPDFLWSEDPWFRPVDIKLGPDGALYVADFYNRIIAHVEVPLAHPGRDRSRGRIWRISYQGTDGQRKLPPAQNFSQMELLELARQLGSPNLTARTLAATQLVNREKDQVKAALLPLLEPRTNSFARLHGMWVLERLGLLADRDLLRLAEDIDPVVRTHAVRVIAERKNWSTGLAARVRDSLRDVDGFVQRAAADGLGRQPSAENFHALLVARAAVPAGDTQLLHTIRMALRDHLRSAEAWPILTENLPEADERAVADVALGVRSPESARFLLRHLRKVPANAEFTVRCVQHAARHGAEDQMTALLNFVRGDQPTDRAHQANLIRAIIQGTQERGGKLSAPARAYAESLVGDLLGDKQAEPVTLGIELAGLLKLETAQDVLADLATRKNLPEATRKSAMSALVSINATIQLKLLGGILADPTEPPPLRDHAAAALAKVNQAQARDELIKALPTAPARLQGVIALGLAGSPQGAELLLQAVTTGKASGRLLQERAVETRLARLPGFQERSAKLTAGLPSANQRLVQLIDQRAKGFATAKLDRAAGAKVFEKHCAICHQLANQGAKVGPQLDGLGARGLDRLLEDVVDPNRNVDQAFRSTTLVLKNGQLVTGLVLREEGEVIVMADQQGKEVRLSNRDVEERVTSPLSPMPANLLEQIPEQDFYHLMAFLLAQKAKEPR